MITNLKCQIITFFKNFITYYIKKIFFVLINFFEYKYLYEKLKVNYLNVFFTMNNWCSSFKKFLSLFQSGPNNMFNLIMRTRNRQIIGLLFFFFRIKNLPEISNTEHSIRVLKRILQRFQIIIIGFKDNNSSFDECFGLFGSGVPGDSGDSA